MRARAEGDDGGRVGCGRRGIWYCGSDRIWFGLRTVCRIDARTHTRG